MENLEIGKKDLLAGGGLQMDERSASEWRQAAGWAKALAILCIVGLCIFILAIVVTFLFSGGRSFLGGAEVVGGIFAFLLILGVGGVWVINLFRFSNNAPAAINNCDVTGFEKSIQALKTFFIISGIISILTVVVTFISLMVR
jgi:hypothetical protein